VCTSFRRWLLCVCLRKYAHLRRDKKHLKSLVDAGFVYDKVRGTQNFHKSRGPPQNFRCQKGDGPPQNCRCQKGDMKQVSY
jgi:hypothetical protein